MKKCTACKKIKTFVEFPVNSSRKDGYGSACKICRKAIRRKTYLKHRKSTIEKNQKWKNDNRDKYQKFKETLSCKVCGESETVCLDFHHLNENEKDFNISEKSHYAFKAILKEIDKCIVLCANCHRKVHKYGIEYIKAVMV